MIGILTIFKLGLGSVKVRKPPQEMGWIGEGGFVNEYVAYHTWI